MRFSDRIVVDFPRGASSYHRLWWEVRQAGAVSEFPSFALWRVAFKNTVDAEKVAAACEDEASTSPEAPLAVRDAYRRFASLIRAAAARAS